eukprot:8510704-Pyramimonas_sp.AAC.1
MQRKGSESRGVRLSAVQHATLRHLLVKRLVPLVGNKRAGAMNAPPPVLADVRRRLAGALPLPNFDARAELRDDVLGKPSASKLEQHVAHITGLCRNAACVQL